ncbi:MAG: response regulator, partial [Acidocella sp.]|nr:response regulator [Acidocella sp.]
MIDDNAANAQLLEARLLRDYYEVKIVIDGAEAINLSNEWQPDVILLDVVMPDMNGYEVCRAIKEAPSTSHIS